jgi:predicted ATPase
VTPLVSSLPTEGVTFLLTDIEGSTRAWQAAPEAMTAPVARHYEILDAAIDAHHGQRPEEQGEGDSIVAVFRTATDAVAAALEAQRNLLRELPDLPVRMALHSGDAMLRNEHNYVGLTIIRCARIRACGHGRQILLSDDTAAQARDALPLGADLTDLGVYGLRDLAGRERVWQLTDPELPAAFPPLKAGASAAGNLPAPISSFVGRAVELAALSHAIAEHRLVVITGDAGLGKSRVAITAAAAAADSLPGGVWWVPLAGAAHDAESVMAAVAQSCAIEPGDDHFDAVSQHFRSVADALVVIDGYEAADGAAEAVERLLGRCPTVRVLATGRQPLGIAGEVVHALAPLATPHDTFEGGRAALAEFDAARLFIERARAAGATARFDDAEAVTIAHICRVLGGVPLAIELAAARCATVSLAQLVASLGTLAAVPAAGGGTLASSIAWSFQLLGDDEQRTLQRLAVFAGSFEIDAAIAVAADAALDDRAAAAAIKGLLRQQLLGIDPGTGRVTMAPAIRQFAVTRLEASADLEPVTSRHGAWFAAVAERFASDGDALPISLLAPDHADVIAAMDAAMASLEPSVAYRIIVALGDRWHPGEHTDTIEHVTTWLCGRSPSDGEQRWAAAVARLADAHATRPHAAIHAYTAEAAAITEMMHDTVSQLFLAHASALRAGDGTAAAAATAALRAAGVARTVPGDMAEPT